MLEQCKQASGLYRHASRWVRLTMMCFMLSIQWTSQKSCCRIHSLSPKD